MTKYGFNISLRNSIEEIENLGEKFLKEKIFDTIEVTYYENMQDVNTSEYNKAIKNLVSKYSPNVTVHLSDFNLCEENNILREAILKEAENCFKYTKDLGGYAVIVHSGKKDLGIHVPVLNKDGNLVDKNDRLNRSWELSVDMMKKICFIAKQYGLLIYTENLDDEDLILTSDELKKYIEDVKCENLKVVFDVGHCIYTSNKIKEEVEIIKEHLEHLHIHDNHGTCDEHLPVGEGILNIEEFINSLKKCKYKGVYMLELSEINVCNVEKSYEILKKCIEK